MVFGNKYEHLPEEVHQTRFDVLKQIRPIEQIKSKKKDRTKTSSFHHEHKKMHVSRHTLDELTSSNHATFS